MNTKRDWLVRIAIGGLAGLAVWVLVSWLTQPGWNYGFEFTFYYGNLVPEAVGITLNGVLWFAFGAECAVATLPFAEEGKELLCRSVAHYFAMVLTIGAWVLLNCFCPLWPMSVSEFFKTLWLFLFDSMGNPWVCLVPFTLVYVLIWLGRWVGWYVEAEAIREKLGLAPSPSPLKWRETLPYLFYAGVLCLVLPFLLRLVDAHDVPVLTWLLVPWVLLPVGGFFSGLSLGKRQGVCPLYPVACGVLYLPAVFLLMNASALPLCLLAAVPAAGGNLIGGWIKRRA